MRVTFNAFPDTLLGRLQSLGSEQNKALTQLSTGQRIAAPSDDAPAMQRILNLRTEKKQNQQFHQNATDGLERNKVTFSSMEQIKDLLVRASELAAGINGASSENEYFAKSSEINQLIEQGLNVGNTKLRGSYLFAGDSPENPAFDPIRVDGKITEIAYVGSQNVSPIRIGEDTQIEVGSSVAENIRIADVLTKLIDLRDAMDAPASPTKADTVIGMRGQSSNNLDENPDNSLDGLENDILSYLSRAGTVQYRLETAMRDLETRYEATEQLISKDADVDFAEATVRLNRAQMAYQAAIQSGAMIQRNSLLDYVR
jgi:flagellar hook-associated protein 3 FlgL